MAVCTAAMMGKLSDFHTLDGVFEEILVPSMKFPGSVHAPINSNILG